MIGVVLAAGAGRRLRPHSDGLPKALVPICDGLRILDVTLANFAEVGVDEVVIVVGCNGERIVELLPELAETTGLPVSVVHNERAAEWNNAYSLWTAREALAQGAIVANGDTLHPASVQRDLLAADAGDALLLAVDDAKVLGDEEMKVRTGRDGRLCAISKLLPHDADGEYIGVSLVPAAVAPVLVDALERTWRADPQEYYEGAFQLLMREGAAVRSCSIGGVPWTEVDDADDLEVAKGLACRF